MDDSHMESLQQQQQQQSATKSSRSGAGAKTAGYFNSYQNDPPAVRQLDGDPSLHVTRPKHSYFGDATLEPNTGLTNSYDYALFGLALHELLDRLRLSICGTALLTLLIEFFSWWRHLLRPFSLVLLIILSIMVMILLVVEVKSIFESAGSNSASTTTTTSAVGGINGDFSNNASMQDKLMAVVKFTETIGLMILYHPIGRMVYLITCASLCFWIGGVVEMGLGVLFVANAAALLYCWVTYPEFRRTFERTDRSGINEGSSNGNGHSLAERASSAAWSYYYQATSSASAASASTIADRVSEQASLLSSAFRRD